jgi:hypothetical protein
MAHLGLYEMGFYGGYRRKDVTALTSEIGERLVSRS